VLITVDQNIPFQQNAANLPIAVVILAASSNRYSDLRALVPKVLVVLSGIKVGEIVTVRWANDRQQFADNYKQAILHSHFRHNVLQKGVG
jgi:hypothetical protein